MKTETLISDPAPDTQLPAAPEALSSQLPALSQSVQPPTVIDATPLPRPCRNARRRNGRIACLPKLQRDMVNRMLWNHVPYKNIVLALDENGFTVTERNVSSWATGGFLEWQAEQEFVLQNRLDQDHLIDHLRRDNASDLPEVGLQAAATRLSQILLQKTANAADLEANLPSVSRMVDVLCRLNQEINLLQKQRDDTQRALGRAHDPARIQDYDARGVVQQERFYSDPPADAGLSKPPTPPALPPIPTSKLLADADADAKAEAAMEAKIKKQDRLIAILQAMENGSSPLAALACLAPSPAVAPMPLPPAASKSLPAPVAAPAGSTTPADAVQSADSSPAESHQSPDGSPTVGVQ